MAQLNVSSLLLLSYGPSKIILTFLFIISSQNLLNISQKLFFRMNKTALVYVEYINSVHQDASKMATMTDSSCLVAKRGTRSQEK